MAQSGYTPISLYFSATGAAVPTAGNLVAGELALNTNDGKLYFKNSSGVVTLLAGSTSGPAGGSTTQVQYNNSGVLAGITGATTDGTALTLVAPNLGSPASVGTMPAFTLGGTIAGGGNQINNVVIGTTTPLAGSFTTVTTTGNAGIGTTAAGSSRLAVVATSLSAATFTQTGATGYGVAIVPGADTVYDAFSINNAANTLNNIQMYGNGSARFAGLVTAQASLAVTGTLSATGTLSGGTSGTAYSFSGSAPATSLTLDSSGNLGIGTSSPAQTLHVKTSTSATPITLGVLSNATGLPALSFNGAYASTTMAGIYANGGTSTSLYYEVPSGNNHFFGIADSTKMTLDSAGNLGLGVTPSAWYTSLSMRAFQVGATASLINYVSTPVNFTRLQDNSYIDASGNNVYITSQPASFYQQTAGAHQWFQAASGTAGNAISFTQAMTLDASGRLGVGTTSPSSYGGFISVDIRGSNGGQLIVANSAATNIGELLTDGNGFNVTARTNNALLFKTNDTERARIDSSGIVTMNAYGAGAATFSASGVISSVSDETWKIKDGVPVDTDAMLKKLEPGYWYYNDEKKETFGSDRQLGFYAQNVNVAIGPEAAPTPQEGKPWGYYDRSVLAITVMSLQKALATIETLTARITALETA